MNLTASPMLEKVYVVSSKLIPIEMPTSLNISVSFSTPPSQAKLSARILEAFIFNLMLMLASDSFNIKIRKCTKQGFQ